MLKNVFIITLLFLLFTGFSGRQHTKHEIEIVFCMDMSGSTNGLIPDFRNKLWETVNGICKLRPYPRIRIGLVGFSRPSFGKGNGYVKVLCGFTEEFDRIDAELSLLKPSIEKGDQFVGAALETAQKMEWSENPDALRIIYLLGNGTVNAGGGNYRNACEELMRRNIYVNAVYCIQQKIITKEVPGWKFIAGNTGGEYFTYKINKAMPLMRIGGNMQSLLNMNKQFNSTYLYYGPTGKASLSSMEAADRQSLEMGDVYFYNRMQYKISGLCQSNQAGWDLVNYVKNSGLKLADLNKSLLPDSIAKMENAALEGLILAKKDERNFLINQVKEHLKSVGQDTIQPDPGQLPGIIISSVNKLGKEKGFVNP